MALKFVDLNKIFDSSQKEEKYKLVKDLLKKDPKAIQYVDAESIIANKDHLESLLLDYPHGI